MTHVTSNPIPKLRKAPQPPLSYPGAAAESDRAKKPRLAEPPANDQDLNPGDRSRVWATSESRVENSVLLSKRTRMTQLSNGMMPVI
jgi:hypothetical protein